MASNDWMEYDGLEVDLSALPFAPKEFVLTFEFVNQNDVQGLADLLGNGVHTFDCSEIDLSLNARAIDYSAYTRYGRGDTLDVRFVVDNPEPREVTSPASHTIPTDLRFRLDGVPFTDYNCRILKGSEASALVPRAPKQYLIRQSKYTNGQIYDGLGEDRLKELDVTLQCLITATGLIQFYKYYDGLFNALVKWDQDKFLEDETTAYSRVLYVNESNQGYKCYYKSQSVSEFAPYGSNKIWCLFTITLCLYDLDETTYELLLAAENDKYIMTQSSNRIKLY